MSIKSIIFVHICNYFKIDNGNRQENIFVVNTVRSLILLSSNAVQFFLVCCSNEDSVEYISRVNIHCPN